MEKNKKVIDMALKAVYLEPTRMGVKTVEYRNCTEYWTKKLVDTESYGGLSVREVMDGLHDGTIDLHPRDWTHILFHESGTGVTLEVAIRYIKFYKGHHCFCIGITNENT